MSTKNIDMTEGNAVKHILVFAVPMLIGNIFQQLYNLADSVIVGKMIGANALAATGATGPLTFFFFALCNGIGSGGGIVTSQYFGSKDYKKVKSCITNTGYIMVTFPLIVGTLAFFLARPLLLLLDTPAEILADAMAYTRIMCVGIIFVSVYNYISSMLRALGDSRTPLYFLVFSCFLNVGLDILFIAVFKMGVPGAGIATVISQLIAGFSCIIYAFKTNSFFKLEKEDRVIRGDIIWSAVRIGVPLSFQFSLIAISTMALQRVVNSFGEIAVAAFTATSRIEQLIHQPYQTLSASLSTFCGQNYGAGKHKRVLEGYRKSLVMMAVFTIMMVPVMQIFGRQITSIFVSDPAVIEMGAAAMKISSLFYIFLGLIYVVRGTLNGVGDAFFALINGVVEVIGRFVVPIAMTAYFGFGVMGIWWSVGIVWFFSGATAWLRYLKYFRKLRIEQV